ncbi:hypothetical protein [Symbioplanes lichenis]|uniref:hypothetical protein n=1 Tax=Symbioplanes lichenis TaxID=1629072 RepID=UPI002738ADF6|nr:hypothetical protein [Actinoplanes lichenis]
MDDAIDAYTAGHADGAARRPDADRATDPATGADYRTGVVDGSVAAFETELIDKIRRLMGNDRG